MSAYSQTGAEPITGVKLVRTYGTNVKIYWNPSTDDYHKKYRVYRSSDGFSTDTTLIVTTTKTDYTDKDAGSGSWSYMVRDLDEFGVESDDSDVVTLTMGALLPFLSSENITTATTYDFTSLIDRYASTGTIENKGPNTLLVELSYDGTTFPKSLSLDPYYILTLEDSKDRIAIHSIRVTSTDSDVSMVIS